MEGLQCSSLMPLPVPEVGELTVWCVILADPNPGAYSLCSLTFWVEKQGQTTIKVTQEPVERSSLCVSRAHKHISVYTPYFVCLSGAL